MKVIKNILIALKITQIRHIKPYPNGYSYKQSRYNPYNPLSYLFLAIGIPLMLFIECFNLVKESGNPFKFN